ncbi:hypothetical protein AB6C88_17235 [Vibrio splendidus]
MSDGYVPGSDTSVTTESCHMPCPDLINPEEFDQEKTANSLGKVQELKRKLKFFQCEAVRENQTRLVKKKNYLDRLALKSNQLPSRQIRR